MYLLEATEWPKGSQASSRGEAKDSALLSSRDASLLEPPERDDDGTTWFFSSCRGILELRWGFQASSCVGPGKPNFPSSCEGKLGVVLESLQGQRDLI